ncbi:MAG: winged helix-turn-helix domain-containing protein, partial [Myxococcota bacterium]
MRATFGPFVFDRSAFRLERDGAPVTAQPKVLEALSLLLHHPGELVTRAELTAALWPDVVVTDQSLRQVVRKLREALGDDEREPQYLATVHGVGYRFLVHPRRTRPLPAERDVFVGRASELAALEVALEGARAVTVVGIGGVGKTRLVRHLLHQVGQRFGERIPCELEEARGLDGVVGAVSEALDVPLRSGDPIEQLGRAIAARGRCLVVLDNFEQVARHAPATVGRWLDLAPEARFVVTSREVLGIDGERPVPLAPLREADAVALFHARAAVSAADAAEVVGLVALLDGLPLAIELAAARTRVLSPAEIRARMGDRFALLARAGRPHDRHATLRATLEWSWSLLSPDERRVMGQLAVFEGSFSVDSAAAVAGGADLDGLQALVDKSLLHRREDRLGMLLTVRAYALESVDPVALAEAERRHAEHFATFAPGPGGDSVDRFERARSELDNLVAACRRAVAGGWPAVARDTLRAVWSIVRRVGPDRVCEQLAAEVAAIELDDASRATVALVEASVWLRGPRSAEAAGRAAEALTLARRLGAAELEVEALTTLGVCRDQAGQPQAASEVLQQAVDRANDLAEPQLVVRPLSVLGSVRWRLGERESGVALMERALELDRRSGGGARAWWILSELSKLRLAEGSADADEQLERALAESERAQQWYAVAQALDRRAVFSLVAGEFEEGRRRSERSLAAAQALGWLGQQGWVLLTLGRIELECGSAAAQGWLERAAAIHGEVGQVAPQALTLGFLAWCEPTPAGRWSAAQRALARGRALGDPRSVADLLFLAGSVAPDPLAARSCFAEGLSTFESLGDSLGTSVLGGHLALVEPASADTERRLDASMAHLERVRQRVEWARLVAGRAER